MQILLIKAPSQVKEIRVGTVFLTLAYNEINMSEMKFPLNIDPPNHNNLKLLWLDGNKLGQKGAQYLAKGYLPQLE